ncbi:metallophosphoesterase family protein [Heyndrickxia sp. NPDC080065]|uniref:metallophosphoesterase family protein n=1 Tax=Heyndrickxia sp. NPDC080065 TaxID=3390568 RepID=UPI003D01A9D9
MSSIQFIHTADLHLDSPFVGLQYLPKNIFKRIQESTFASLIKIVDAAISMNVDFVLICGDLYDGEDRSIKAQARLRKQMERLNSTGIHVFMLYGNHDHLNGKWTTIEMPPNVHVFSSKVEMKKFMTKNDMNVHIYGFSYPERHVTEKKINDYQKINEADFHIGMLHGHCEGGISVHQPYAPFTITDLLEKGLDYWALGHIHKQQILHKEQNPFIVYPGNIQGRNKKEEGTKGCFAVTLSDQETTLQHIETADIIWEHVILNAKSIKTFSDLYVLCKKEIENQRRNSQGVLLRMQIENVDELEKGVLGKIENGELLEALQDGEDYEETFVWIYQIECETSEYPDGIEEAFKKELAESITELSSSAAFEQAIDELYGHIFSGRYLDKISVQEQNDLLRKAENIVSRLIQSNL